MEEMEVVPESKQDIDSNLTDWEKTLIILTRDKVKVAHDLNMLNAQIKEAEINVKQLTRKFWISGKG